MSENFDFGGGIIVSPIVVQLALAFVLSALISYVLLRLKFYTLVWHRPIVEIAIFCIVLGLIVVSMRGGQPLIAPNIVHSGVQSR